MLYFANPTRDARPAMAAGLLGAIMSPAQGNKLPSEVLFCVDNNCGPDKNGQPGTAYPGDEAYVAFLQALGQGDGYDDCDPDASWCLFAVAPDVLGDAAATLKRSRYMLGWIRYAGFRAALVAQDGLEYLPVPWDDFDALFIGGSTRWKLGVPAAALATEARRRGKWIHMGRVNTRQRLRYAAHIGCDSADGTGITRAPRKNITQMLRWLDEVNGQLALFGVSGQSAVPA